MRLQLILATAAPLASALLFTLGPLGCGSSTTTGTTTTTSTSTSTTGSGGAGGGSTTAGTGGVGGVGGAGCPNDPVLAAEELPDLSDPAMGSFTMEQALVGLPEGPGPLRAVFETDLGNVVCALQPEKVPTGVANFVGLARGLRPWKDPATKKWVKRRFYDGLLFHRVIAGFMAQGGDPLGTGYGGPGYSFAGEIAPDLSHVPGTLAYANPGSNSNGSQFYITETKQTGLDGSYVIFGLCNDAESLATVKALTHVMTDAKDRPLSDLHLKSVSITRCAP
jgi:peptidyl-prolyl cis-trans isomerase A (cyclophilin A)